MIVGDRSNNMNGINNNTRYW